MAGIKGHPTAQLRWSVNLISVEFGCDNQWVAKKLRAANCAPGDDGKYSTKQAILAIYGDEDAQFLRAKIKDTKAGAFLKEVKTDNLLRNNIPSSMVEKVWCDYIRDVTEKIKQSSLPLNERNDLLADLGKIPIEKYFENLKTDEDDEAKDTDLD